MPEPIRLYLDFASPYAYFAIDAADRLAAAHGRTVEWRPILVWAILKAQGVAPPMDSSARRAYFLADMTRSAAFYHTPYNHPAKFPLSSHRAARLYYAIGERDLALARLFGRALFTAYFVDRADISDEATLAALAANHGVDAPALREGLDGEVGRRRLAEAIDAGVTDGVCGSPFFLIDGEGFFGADRLPQIAWRLSQSGTAQRRSA
jgi:2-hydroxychromene-2-carboxylate isomerase